MGLRLAGLAVTLVLLLAGLEALSLAWVYSKRGAVYYAAERKSASDVPAALQIPEAVFHPYMGFIHRVGRTGEGWRTNNVGFQVAEPLARDAPDCCDIPHARRDNEVLVGVFGGSVATSFAMRAQVDATLARRLQEISAYRDRPVRVLNFAMPAFRQPQQMIALAYFQTLGQELDIALEIDGFNEVVTSQRNFQSGVEPSFPADTLWGEWGRQIERQGGRSGEAAAEAGLAGYYRFAAQRWMAESGQCFFAACHLGKAALAKLSAWRAQRLERGLRQTTATLFPTTIRTRPAPGFDVVATTADQWRDASIAMASLARQNGTLYLHVVQPNQWWQAAGDYQPIAADHIYGWVPDLVNKGYPAIVARTPALKAAGVELLDATLLFKDRAARAMYVDDCCHYTDQGNDLLAGAIADQVAAIQAEGRAPASRR
ncbi:MAG: hypothetical protein JNM30_02085 [Rhodospirillales bacterium]|nr:hypothetical protein [Rhodospirillales bacterium]